MCWHCARDSFSVFTVISRESFFNWNFSLARRKGKGHSPGQHMSKSLLEQLPEIVRAGKRQAERIMEGLESRSRVGLQTRELVTPAKDTNWQEFQSLKPHAKAQATLGGEFSNAE